MRSDLIIAWTEFTETIPTIYGQTAAATRALNWFVALAAMGMLVLQMLGPGLDRRRRISFAFVTFLIALVFGLGFYAIADVRPTRTTATSWPTAMNNFLQDAGAIEQFALERNSGHPLTFGELTREVPVYLKGRPPLRNVFTGELLRNEATAGNITLKDHTNEIHVMWFDIYGDPHQIAVFSNSPAEN